MRLKPPCWEGPPAPEAALQAAPLPPAQVRPPSPCVREGGGVVTLGFGMGE